MDNLTDEDLLALRFCELGVKIDGTWIEEGIEQLYTELTAKNIGFKPRCYLADEWLCPDGEPVIGIPFYLAHSRLKKLENRMMMEVEGGDKPSFMCLLRHEAGHAINYAYTLYRRKQWKQLFGHFHAEYPDNYKYRPYSKSFVRHLDFHLNHIFAQPNNGVIPAKAGISKHKENKSVKLAYKLICSHQKEILNYVASWTGEKKY